MGSGGSPGIGGGGYNAGMSRLAAVFLIAGALLAPAQEPPPQDDAALLERLKAAAANGESVEMLQELAGTTEKHEGCDLTPIRVNGPDIHPGMAMSDRGDVLWLSDRTGLVRRILLPSWREDRRFWTGDAPGGMADCKRGLLVTIPSKSRIFLMDESRLKVLDRFTVREATSVVAQPHGFLAFVPKTERGLVIELDVIDAELNRFLRPVVALEMLKAADPVPKYRRHASSQGLSTFDRMVMAPKGDFLYCTSADTFFRVKVNGTTLEVDEAGPNCGKITDLALSPDGQWLAVTAPQDPPRGLPAVKPYGSWVFRTKDLQKVEYSVPEVRVRGFTRAAEKTWGFRDTGELVVMTRGGKVALESSRLVAGQDDIRAVLTHPEGTKFVILTRRELLWVELK